MLGTRPAAVPSNQWRLSSHVAVAQDYAAAETLTKGEREAVSPKVDVYAFGVLLFELLSGEGCAAPTRCEERSMKALVVIFDQTVRPATELQARECTHAMHTAAWRKTLVLVIVTSDLQTKYICYIYKSIVCSFHEERVFTAKWERLSMRSEHKRKCYS